MEAPVLDWEGQQGAAWAAEWKRTDRSFAGITDQLLSYARRISFSCVLDVGCGAGELSLALARDQSRARILGVDISPRLIDAARGRASNLANVSFEAADAAKWRPQDDFRADFVVSRHGVMFFDDPVAAFRNIAGRSADGARLLFSCFRSPADNPFFTRIAELLPAQDTPPDPCAPGPMAFADRARTAGLLEDAGWIGLSFEPLDCAMVVGAGENPIEDAVAFFTKIGPAARFAANLDEAAKSEFFAGLRKVAEDNCHGSIVALRAGIWIVTGRKG